LPRLGDSVVCDDAVPEQFSRGPAPAPATPSASRRIAIIVVLAAFLSVDATASGTTGKLRIVQS
jgi:hypothetical protein